MDRIQADHEFIDRCVTAGHNDEREWIAVEIEQLHDEQRRVWEVARRTLSERLAVANWSCDKDAFDLISRLITEHEAHRP